MLQGAPQNAFTLLDKHFEAAIKAATASADAQHEVILRWLYAAARIMVSGSLWWGTRTVNSRVTDFVRSLTKREHQPLFELLPPRGRPCWKRACSTRRRPQSWSTCRPRAARRSSLSSASFRPSTSLMRTADGSPTSPRRGRFLAGHPAPAKGL